MQFAETDDVVRRCADVVVALRPHLTEDEIVAQVKAQQAENYFLAFREFNGVVVSVAGFRSMYTLAWGRILYIDDFVTRPSTRGQGHGGILLDEVVGFARDQGCRAVHLDSGFSRHDAHRLYLNHGFELSTHHLAHTFDATT